MAPPLNRREFLQAVAAIAAAGLLPACDNDGRLGFRVPCVLIGPRVKRGHVENMLFEPNSILKLMEWRWGLRPQGVHSLRQKALLAGFSW